MSANDVDARARAQVPPSEVSPTVPSQAESAGLSEVEAAKRLAQYGENALAEHHVGVLERTRADAASVHRAEHLDVADRVQAEAFGNAGLHQFQNALNGGFGVFGGHKVKVALAGRHAEIGHRALIDAMGVSDDPAPGGLPEHLGEAHHGHDARADDVGQYLPGSDRGQLVDIADNQQRSVVRTRSTRPASTSCDDALGSDFILACYTPQSSPGHLASP